MDCSDARVAISALLDDEAPGIDPSELSLHVAGCDECLAWRERAHEITRRARLAPARTAPMADSSFLELIRERAHDSARSPTDVLCARVLLAVVALAQMALTLPALIFGTDHEAPMHVAHEMGSFGMALALGFLIVVCQPTRARGMHALVGLAAALLIVTAVIDLLAGRTSISDEAPHLLVVAGWVLMWQIAVRLPIDADGRYGEELVRRRDSASFGLDAGGWPYEPERAVRSEAPAVERRAASA